MIDFTIKCDTEAGRDAVAMFVKTYKEQMAEYVNLELRDKGQLVDSGFIIGEDGTLTLFQVAEDKGYVLAHMDEVPYWEVKKLQNVGDDEPFIRMTKNGLTLFLKSEAGIPDLKVGEFKTIDDAVTEFSSESVAKAIAAALASKKEQLKQIKKLLKLGKVEKPVEATEEVLEPMHGEATSTEESDQVAQMSISK